MDLWILHFRGKLCSYFNLGLTKPTPNSNRQPTAPTELGEAVATLVCKVQLMKTSQASWHQFCNSQPVHCLDRGAPHGVLHRGVLLRGLKVIKVTRPLLI